MGDISEFIVFGEATVLNATDEVSGVKAIFAADGTSMQSDADEQLLIYVPFREVRGRCSAILVQHV
jgi:hypothetical protein